MKVRILRKMIGILAVTILGMAIGSEVTNAVSNQAKARERSFATVQASLSVTEMLCADLERAGYYQTSSTVPGLSVKIENVSPLRVENVDRETLSLRSVDGREAITYRFIAGQLWRSEGKVQHILLQRIAGFRFQRVREGEMINVAFSLGVEPEFKITSTAMQFTFHFRRANEG